MLLKNTIISYLKNLPGWRTSKKLIIFSVDDYGNVRMASEKARQNLKRKGLNIDANRFDQFDCLENAEDLANLFEVLYSVKDVNDKPAVFTAFALPVNIDFERMKAEGFTDYRYKLLPDTLADLPGYEKTWSLWKEGIRNNLLYPEFHGREHVNVPLLMQLLKDRNASVLACFDEHCLGGLTNINSNSISYVAAFDFWNKEQNISYEEVIRDGLEIFESVFGHKAKHFNAPGVPAHSCLEAVLSEGGIRFIDAPFIKKEHQGLGNYSYKINYWGKANSHNQFYLLRNCIFEPLQNKNLDFVDSCMAEIKRSFACGKPGNISSHRVNFSGGINSDVRDYGLKELKRLLKSIIKHWPDVEFVTSSKAAETILQTYER